jgi:hypothetical protein
MKHPVHWYSCTGYSCHILMKLEFYQHIFEKYSNNKFRQNLSTDSRIVPCWLTDMKKLIVAFGKFAGEKTAQQHGLAHRDCIYATSVRLSVRLSGPTAERIFLRPVILEFCWNTSSSPKFQWNLSNTKRCSNRAPHLLLRLFMAWPLNP